MAASARTTRQAASTSRKAPSKRGRTRSSVATAENLPATRLPRFSSLSNLASKNTPPLWAGWVAFLVLLLALIGLGAWRRNWVVAGIVNNQPIWGLQVLNRLDQDYRKGELDDLVNEKIILSEAAKRNAVPTDAEVKQRMSELEQKYGGADTFNQLIEQQGESRLKVERQVKLQIAMEKMFGNEVSITDQEIDDYIKANKASLKETDPAKQKEEARGQLRDQKQREVFSKHFQDLKNSAKVRLF